MGLFDDAVPGGNIAKPLLIALGALLAGKMLSGSKDEDPAPERQAEPPQGNAPHQQAGRQQSAPPDQKPANQDDGSLLDGGLGGLLERLAKNGQGQTADSWVKPDTRNEPIAPQDLGSAIGDRLLSELSRRTGIPQDQLLEQLSKALPGVVDRLTPNGNVPSNDEVAGQFRKNPW